MTGTQILTPGRTKSMYLHGISMIILFVLLQSVACDNSAEDAKEYKLVHFVNQDGRKVDEYVGYDEKRNLAVIWKPGTVFQIDDFSKGIDIVKDMETGICSIVPVGLDQESSEALKRLLRTYKGEDLADPGHVVYEVEVLPDDLLDRNLIPAEADDECDGYQMVSVVKEIDNSEDDSRRKRGWLSKAWKKVKKAVKKAVVLKTVGAFVG